MPRIHSIEKKRTAILLRQNGQSLRAIAYQLHISLSTAQLWTKEVILSEEQKLKIVSEHKQKLTLGQKKFNKQRKEQRLKIEQEIFEAAKNEIGIKKSDSFFMMGLALYWAEGSKKDHALGFVNSDPIMIQFFLKWLKCYGKIESQNIHPRVQIHEIYKPGIDAIQSYWSECIQTPLSQFQVPFYQKSLSKPNLIDPKYRGLLRIRVSKTRNFFIQILGWLEGLRLTYSST